MTDLKHLEISAIAHTQQHILITLCENMDDYIDSLRICERAAEEPNLEYEIGFSGRPRADLVDRLKEVIAILEELPDEGTLEEIAAAMGTTMAALEI